LLPLPHTIRTGPGRAVSRTAAATASPAASISSSDGTPRLLIAHESAARIPRASYSGSSHGSIVPGAYCERRAAWAEITGRCARSRRHPPFPANG
jgi:hypothetical protein